MTAASSRRLPAFLITTGVSVAASMLGMATAQASANVDPKVDVCHATSSGKNAWVGQTISAASAAERAQAGGEDIIAPFTYEGAAYELNWNETTAVILGNGCVAPAPASEPPVEQPPVEQPPVEQPPVEQPPVEQPPVEQPPVEQPPAADTPVDDTPVDDTPVDDTPVDETTVDETPADETPVDETTVDETPADETTVDETPVDEPPAEVITDAPTDETPNDNGSGVQGNGTDAPAETPSDNGPSDTDTNTDGTASQVSNPPPVTSGSHTGSHTSTNTPATSTATGTGQGTARTEAPQTVTVSAAAAVPQLASTGAGNTPVTIGIALLITTVGAATVTYVRRRTA